MGEVFLASKQGLTKPCVVKVLLPKFSRNPQYRRRFFREAKILAGLRHGRIVPVIDFGEDKGFLYLIMEFIDGVNLQSFFEALARGGQTIPFDLVAYIAGEILEALRHAHERTLGGHPRGVIHRDIKPSNVLISSEGEVLLTDFGIARYEADMSAEMFGTIAYMAPEQALGTATFQSDLYGASGLVHYMLTGEAPRQARNIAELHAALADPAPGTGRDGVPEPLERLRLLGLEPDVALRLESARSGLMILEAWKGYRKQTTHIAELYERYVGPRRSGMTELHRAAKDPNEIVPEATRVPMQRSGAASGAVVDRTVRVGSPAVAASGASQASPEPASEPESAPGTKPPAEPEPPPVVESPSPTQSDDHIWEPWWEREEPSDEATTTQYIEPDAPRLFRRRPNPHLRMVGPRVPRPQATELLDPPSQSTDVEEGTTDVVSPPSPSTTPGKNHRATPSGGLVGEKHHAETRPECSEESSPSVRAVTVVPPPERSRTVMRWLVASIFAGLGIVLGVVLVTTDSNAELGGVEHERPASLTRGSQASPPPYDENITPASATAGIPRPNHDPVSAGPGATVPADVEPAGRSLELGAQANGGLGERESSETDGAAIGIDEPSSERTQPDRIRVVLVIDGVLQGEFRLGQGTVRSFKHLATMKLRPGRYPLSWREQPGAPWRDVDDLRVVVEDPTSQYVLARVSRLGTLHLDVKDKPKASGR